MYTFTASKNRIFCITTNFGTFCLYRVTLLTQFIQVKAIFACFFTTRYVQAYTLYMKLKTNYK